jgi:hypothetical protein
MRLMHPTVKAQVDSVLVATMTSDAVQLAPGVALILAALQVRLRSVQEPNHDAAHAGRPPAMAFSIIAAIGLRVSPATQREAIERAGRAAHEIIDLP